MLALENGKTQRTKIIYVIQPHPVGDSVKYLEFSCRRPQKGIQHNNQVGGEVLVTIINDRTFSS